MNSRTLGQKIKLDRKAKKISLRAFARQLGISASYLVDIEKDRRLPSEEILQKVADLLGIATSSFDDFAPDIPKPVKNWFDNNLLIARVLKVFRNLPNPEKILNDLEKSLILPKTQKFLIAIYESELQAIGLESSFWNTETGGDLFGIWGDMPVIYLATRSGPNAIRDRAHFRLDVNYLIKISAELQNDWGLRYFGDWHSHHQLGLEKPSSEDQARIKRVASKNNFHEMAEFIVNFSPSNDTDKKTNINPYIYPDIASNESFQVMLIVLKGISPVREALLAASLFPEQELGSFSLFPIDRIAIPNEPLPRVSGTEGVPMEQISKKVMARAFSELNKMSSEKIEFHTTSFGYIIVIPINKHKNVAFAVDKKWPHKILQVDWMDRSCGKTEEFDIEIEQASLIKIEEMKKILLTAKSLKKEVLI
jgi:transcriptional regulator with XRE-family HTH domain